MKLLPLQLESYFTTEVTFRANPEFATGQPSKFGANDLDVTAECARLPNTSDRWQVTLHLKFQPPPTANSPYYFALQLVGVLWAAPMLPPDKVEALVRTNGPSLLFGVARELVRELSARGPFSPLMLPSLSFLPGNAESVPANSQAAEAAAK